MWALQERVLGVYSSDWASQTRSRTGTSGKSGGDQRERDGARLDNTETFFHSPAFLPAPASSQRRDDESEERTVLAEACDEG